MNKKYIATTGLAGLLAAGAATANSDLEARVAELEALVAGSSKGAQVANSNSWFQNTSIGGYGELHANFDLDDSNNNEIDFHRFVLFINHTFTDKIRFVSELELEHSLAGDDKPGEVELEQAYIEMDLANDFQLRSGLFLMPVGLLNETHEPNTFFGVERNNVEKNIIPTTWWEAGAGITKKFDNGLSFDLAVTSALDVDGSMRIRSGRQKVAEANFSDAAVTGRIVYTGVAGLRVTGFAQHQTDIDQANSEDNAATLLGGTVEYNNGGFAVRALYSQWDIDRASYAAAGADDQHGFYVEPSYTWEFANGSKAGVFGRYSEYQYYNGKVRDSEEYSFGGNYWPIDNVVFKADFTSKNENGNNNDSVNLGVGYQF